MPGTMETRERHGNAIWVGTAFSLGLGGGAHRQSHHRHDGGGPCAGAQCWLLQPPATCSALPLLDSLGTAGSEALRLSLYLSTAGSEDTGNTNTVVGLAPGLAASPVLALDLVVFHPCLSV